MFRNSEEYIRYLEMKEKITKSDYRLLDVFLRRENKLFPIELIEACCPNAYEQILISQNLENEIVVRRAALARLQDFDIPSMATPLIYSLENDPSPYVKSYVIVALSKVKDARAFPFIAKILQESKSN